MTIREFIPREHGAWAMWIVPMLSAALVTKFTLRFVILFVSFALLYVVHHPMVTLIKRKRLEPGEMSWLLGTAVPAVLLGLTLIFVFKLWWLLLFGVMELAIFAYSVKTFLSRDQRSFLNELTVVGALTLSAPAAYYTSAGMLDAHALTLYALDFLFFGSSVFYVKTRIEYIRTKGIWNGAASRSRAILVLYHLVLACFLITASLFGLFGAWLTVGFVPMLVQVVGGVTTKKSEDEFYAPRSWIGSTVSNISYGCRDILSQMMERE